MDLDAAIQAAKQAGETYSGIANHSAVIQQVVVDDLEAKLSAARALITLDKSAQVDAAAQLNAALDDLIQAATEAKIA